MDAGKATPSVTIVADNSNTGPKLDVYSYDTSLYVSPYYQLFFVFYTLGDDYHNPTTQSETYFHFYMDYNDPCLGGNAWVDPNINGGAKILITTLGPEVQVAATVKDVLSRDYGNFDVFKA